MDIKRALKEIPLVGKDSPPYQVFVKGLGVRGVANTPLEALEMAWESLKDDSHYTYDVFVLRTVIVGHDVIFNTPGISMELFLPTQSGIIILESILNKKEKRLFTQAFFEVVQETYSLPTGENRFCKWLYIPWEQKCLCSNYRDLFVNFYGKGGELVLRRYEKLFSQACNEAWENGIGQEIVSILRDSFPMLEDWPPEEIKDLVENVYVEGEHIPFWMDEPTAPHGVVGDLSLVYSDIKAFLEGESLSQEG